MAALTWLKDAVKRFARAHRCKHSVAQVVPPDCTIPTQVLICPEILNRSQKQKGDISPKGPKPNSCPGKLEKVPPIGGRLVSEEDSGAWAQTFLRQPARYEARKF
eukprot:gnl/MRDRNA2_/MRDRNA2_28641_c0_seq1.p1 gnl/MRDRNA2_/MRDRNA2_28641_c0~~gnl/MRDRNA2_/MRDRNA2_28641_c0_seq1.p1  ORF type:complete len:105 (+),score=21.50 gnl/MRDRNA2_/MRDRNA2_28641_c0_seq1:134-448(+)